MSTSFERSGNYIDPRDRPQPQIPDDIDEAARVLEDQFHADVRYLDSVKPEFGAPLSEHLAYLIAWARVRADSEIIASIHERNFDGIQAISEVKSSLSDNLPSPPQ